MKIRIYENTYVLVCGLANCGFIWHLPGRGRADDVPRRPAQAHAGVQAREGCAFSQGDVRLDLHRRRRTGPCRTPRGDQVHRRAALDLAGCCQASRLPLFLQHLTQHGKAGERVGRLRCSALSARSPRAELLRPGCLESAAVSSRERPFLSRDRRCRQNVGCGIRLRDPGARFFNRFRKH